MSCKSSNTNNVLVVPPAIIAGFKEVSIGNKENTNVELDTPRRKISYYMKKSTLVSVPLVSAALTVSSFSTAISVIGDNAFIYGALILGATFSTIGGIGGLTAGLVSISEGDRSFAPLPASKKYLELKEKAKQVSIAPFDSWDSIFEKNNIQAINDKK